MEEFSKPQYRVDMLKVEVPINAEYVEGSSVYKGQKAYTREEALKHFREAAAIAHKAIYLLERRREQRAVHGVAEDGVRSGTDYSGVLCGRATWKEGIPVYAKKGVQGAGRMASTRGRKEHQRGQRRGSFRHAVVHQARSRRSGVTIANQFDPADRRDWRGLYPLCM